MGMVRACTGQQSEKTIGSVLKSVTPFVGSDREGEISQLGIGLIDGTSASFWGLLVPHLVIRSWRAMKILEQLQTIQADSLCACYYAARREIDDTNKNLIESLANLFGGINKFEAVRRTVLASAPSADELNEMLAIFHA